MKITKEMLLGQEEGLDKQVTFTLTMGNLNCGTLTYQMKPVFNEDRTEIIDIVLEPI